MSIYSAPPVEYFTLAVPDALAEGLPFPCNSVSVDNYTNQYIYFPDIGRYVPPNTFGAILPYKSVNGVRATFVTPPGYGTSKIVSGQIANIVCLAEPLPPSPGISIPVIPVISDSFVITPVGASLGNMNTFPTETLYTAPADQYYQIVSYQIAVQEPPSDAVFKLMENRSNATLVTNFAPLIEGTPINPPVAQLNVIAGMIRPVWYDDHGYVSQGAGSTLDIQFYSQQTTSNAGMIYASVALRLLNRRPD